MLRRADQLLIDAGWTQNGNQRVNEKEESLTIEFLESSQSFERIVLPFIGNLKRLGIQASFRLVDSAQYQSRLKNFDFDITTRRFSFSTTPGAELQQFFSSQAASVPGSNNLSGLDHPAIDAMLKAIENAENRTALHHAARALDRILRSLHFWIPQWYKASHTLAYWDQFSMPKTKPHYGFPYEALWWQKRSL